MMKLFDPRTPRLSTWLKTVAAAAVVFGLLCAILAAPPQAAQTSPVAAEWQVIRQEGQGKLIALQGQKVLLLKGSPYEMGLQHGRLLATEVAEDAQAYLHDWAIGKSGESTSSLKDIFESLQPFIPTRYMEEMRGLAEGSGVPLEEIHLLHAIPTRFHCTGAAAFGKATVDGRLYHTRSLDYSLDIGDKKTAQENALLIVYQPDDGNAHAVIAFAGLIGCVSGMNDKGISIGEIGNKCRDESYAGMPMILMLREALRTSRSLEDVIGYIRGAPRTCGFTFIVGDGKIPSACALEVSHSRMAVGLPGDPKSDPAPHFPIPDAIRRGNYFVDTQMAAVQRDIYDPRISSPMDWLGYSVMSSFLRENLGRLDGLKMIDLLRKYPPEHPCLHQAVFCPSSLEFWVSNAVSPAVARYAGAQNQPFYKYNLARLVAGEPFTVEVAEPPARPAGQLPRPETGDLKVSEREEFRSQPLSRFRLQKESFDWVLTYTYATEKYFVADLSFPSPLETSWPEANTVYAEYYRPRVPLAAVRRTGGLPSHAPVRPAEHGDVTGQAGRVPGIIVLDILQGNFLVARTVARNLAENGIAALAVHMPFFGKRKPHDDPDATMLSPSISFTVELMTQAVLDIRSAALWLRAREEINGERTGVVGVSLGAVIGGLVIGVDDSFVKNALVLGGGDVAQILWTSPESAELKQKLEEKGYTLEKLREELQPVDPLTYAHRINRSTVLLFNAKKDETVIPDCTTKFWEKAGQPRIIWYDTSHVGMAPYINTILEQIVAFIQE
ncbi:MAG: C45 family autoproteolytic acyltransferase/hydrolase [bacterium]|nr:C45 family autoproteolytic acyltransferase/hydrolase [bacterium]